MHVWLVGSKRIPSMWMDHRGREQTTVALMSPASGTSSVQERPGMLKVAEKVSKGPFVNSLTSSSVSLLWVFFFFKTRCHVVQADPKCAM